MRSKEDAHDYRYFPEPDLPPLEVSEEWVERLRDELPELPEARRQRFMRDYDLIPDESFTLTSERKLADYFETAARASNNTRAAANWILSELLRELKNADVDITGCKIKPEDLGAMIRLIDDKTISGKIAKDVFAEMFATGKAPAEIVKEKGLAQITDASAIEKIVDEVIAANPKQVENYRGGKTALMGFFVGQVLKASGGKANPQAVNEILKNKLDGLKFMKITKNISVAFLLGVFAFACSNNTAVNDGPASMPDAEGGGTARVRRRGCGVRDRLRQVQDRALPRRRAATRREFQEAGPREISMTGSAFTASWPISLFRAAIRRRAAA